MRRFAFSLRDGLAVVLVICLVLGSYRYGYEQNRSELNSVVASSTRHAENEFYNDLIPWLSSEADWLALRDIILSRRIPPTRVPSSRGE